MKKLIEIILGLAVFWLTTYLLLGAMYSWV